MRYRSTLVVVCAAILFFTGCGFHSSRIVQQSTTTTTTTPAITVTSPTGSARLGDAAIQFSATMTGGAATGYAWAVNGTAGGSATLGTIDSTGKYTPPAAGAVVLQNPTTISITASANGVTSTPVTLALHNPVPTVTAGVGTPVVGLPTAIQITGTNFVPGAQVIFGGAAVTTTVDSATQVTATVTAAAAGNVSVEVKNPDPGGVTSGSITLAAVDPNPVPAITSLSPSSKIAGGSGFTLTVNGTGFIAGSIVYWNGAARATTFVSGIQLTAAITAVDINAAGNADVTVFNPAPGGGTSGASTFTISAQPPGAQAVSVTATGVMGDGNSFGAAASFTGRYVAFESNSSNLGSWSGFTSTIYVRDTCVGAPAGCTYNMIPVSVKADGTPWVGFNPAISADGRYVAYDTVMRGTGVGDVYVRDTCIGAGAGCTPATTQISVAPDGTTSGDAASYNPSISADGRYVSFFSYAKNLTSDNPTYSNVFLRDTCAGAPAGCTPSTMIVSLQDNGSLLDYWVTLSNSISATGRFVVFVANENAVAQYANNVRHVFVRDTCIGASACTPSTTIVSVATDGTLGNDQSYIGQRYNYWSTGTAISADGRFVSFVSDAKNLVAGDTNNTTDIFLRDTCAGASSCTPSTTMLSVVPSGVTQLSALPRSDSATISADGRFVAFVSDAVLVTSPPILYYRQAYVRDTCAGAAAGCTPSTVLVSQDSSGNAATTGENDQIPWMPFISGDGHQVVFSTCAKNLTNMGYSTANVFRASTPF